MPRINPTVSDKAFKIYSDLDHFDRGKFVSDAIEEKHNKGSLEKRIEVLEQKIKELEMRLK